jgi:hypothetical protein
VIPDDQRRCGSFAWPPCKTNYAWTSLQGLFSQAVVLDRLGYDVWNWEDQALLRSIRWLHLTTFDDGQNYAPVGDDEWLSYLVNSYYNSTLAVNPQPRPGKIMGWTEWTHAASGNP